MILALLLFAAPTSKVKVAVMDIKSTLSKDLTASLTALVPQALDELGPFKAISRADIEQMLAVERMKDAVGCGDSTCLAEIGGALGADYIVTGSLVYLGDTYVLQLQLLNIKTARAEQRVSREYKGAPQGLLEETRIATKQLMRDQLAQKSGQLALVIAEEGATVRVDGSIVGTTPLKPLSVAGGQHTLMVEKEGFVRSKQDVNVVEAKTTQTRVVLVPSEEFRKAFVQKATLYRALAITFTALAAASVGGGIAGLFLAKAEFAKTAAAYDAYNAADIKEQSEYDRLRARSSNVFALDALTVGGFVAAGVFAAVGVTLFVVGDAPSKYDSVKTRVGLSVSPNRVALSVGF